MPIVTQEISNNIHTAPENPCCAPIPRLHLITPQSQQASRGFEARSLDSESRVLTVTPRGQVSRTEFLANLRSSKVTYRKQAWEGTLGR